MSDKNSVRVWIALGCIVVAAIVVGVRSEKTLTLQDKIKIIALQDCNHNFPNANRVFASVKPGLNSYYTINCHWEKGRFTNDLFVVEDEGFSRIPLTIKKNTEE